MNDTAVDAHHILPFVDKCLPERILDVAFQFRAERSVIEKSGESIVDFRGGENNAATFAEGDDFVHFEVGVGLFVFMGPSFLSEAEDAVAASAVEKTVIKFRRDAAAVAVA